MLTSPWFRWNEALISASKNVFPIRSGYIGYPARIIQLALMKLGHSMPKTNAKYGSPDGIFGQETKQSVVAFQKKQSLSRDGVVGQNTMAKLDELVRGPWTPPPAIDGPGDIKHNDDNAKNAVLQALSGGRPQLINFNYQGISVGANDYIQIGEAVYYEWITVKAGHLSGATGHYSPQTNTMTFPFFMANTAKRRSTIIHEATHAAMDRRRLVMSTIQSESIAWIAQSLYLRLSGIDRLSPGFGGKAQTIYLAANTLAEEWRKGHHFNKTSVKNLEAALKAMPHYNHSHDFQGDGF